MSSSRSSSSLILQEIYYQPEQLWTGKIKPVQLLREASGKPKKKVESWLARQEMYQTHYPRPKRIDYPHFYETKVNGKHQGDLMFLPSDKVHGNLYKCNLNVIDLASGYGDSVPLRNKTAKEVAEAFKVIYGRRGGLKFPEEIMVDNGNEFKGAVKKLFKEHGVKINQVTTAYNKHHMGPIENYNKRLAELLFKLQDAQELNDKTKVSKTWVKHNHKMVKRLNNRKLERIGMTPAEAIKLKEVTLKVKAYGPEQKQPVDGLFRYLLQPGEEHGDHKRRATDRIWSKGTYRLSEVIENPGQRVLYYLADGPERSFVYEELMLIPEDTEAPPDWVQEW